jgi:CBS domain-containing protein
MDTRIEAILNDKGRQVHSVPIDSTVLEAARAMNRARVGAVLVVVESRLVGIFSERDILTRVVEQGLDAATTRVRDVMTERVAVVHPQTTVAEAMAVMTERRCRHLPVFDGGQLSGIVSIGDLTRWTVHDRNFLIEQLYNYVTDQYPA